ncbi:calpain-8-like [Tachysurus vachellii]|uniref:calpain-8-like n=1 Tax=Tachysurus vachellii TaxID=175792 RepID=UPI00296B3B6A|nr:calpain-8-like [Tachysurus vachellii]XP_060725430.1 calpain-8-like [Tachysurus vachellii]XP_060725431.1 calpain-8-like [Tachysurus vachellii]XP_060725432.1 calpain-8-like [Tachysurus vachellii]
MAPQKNKRRKLNVDGDLNNPQKFQDQDFLKLHQKCLNNKELFVDDKFPAARRAIGSGLLTRTQVGKVVWKRPSELVDDPCLIVDGESRFDFSQGELGNCWFLAAIGAITFQKDIMDQVIPDSQSFDKDYAGIFHFRFYRNGKWVDVVIDDQLPTLSGQLIFIHCKTRNEFWPALLEKAYAKVCGSYAALNGGFIFDGLHDFTGGIYRTFNLKEAPDNLWDLMDQAVKRRALIGCGTPQGPTSANTVLPNGIVQGHAYTVTGVTKIKSKGKMVKLVRLLNPWGKGEWKGDWSDNSRLWNDLSEKERESWLEIKNNGEFWMSMEDFCSCYDELDICCIGLDFLV